MTYRNLYDFLSEHPAICQSYNELTDQQRLAVVKFMEHHDPVSNKEMYVGAIIEASRYPKGFNLLSLQNAVDGKEACAAVQQHIKTLSKEMEKDLSAKNQIEQIKNYIDSCRHEDLKTNFSCIPDNKKDEVVKEAIQQFGEEINSRQLREFMYEKAVSLTQEMEQTQNEVNIKTSHAEHLTFDMMPEYLKSAVVSPSYSFEAHFQDFER